MYWVNLAQMWKNKYFASTEGKPNKQKQKGENYPYSSEDKGHSQWRFMGGCFFCFPIKKNGFGAYTS